MKTTDSHDALIRLQDLAVAVISATTTDAVASAFSLAVSRHMGAEAAWLYETDDREHRLCALFAGAGVGPPGERVIPLHAPHPLTDSVRRGAPVVLRDSEERAAAYPGLQPAMGGALTAVPLRKDDRVIGGALVVWPGERILSPDESVLLEAACRLCAAALGKLRAAHPAPEPISFERFAENSPDIISRFDRDLRHTFVSAAVKRATGLPPEAFLGKTNRDLGMPAELCDHWDTALRNVFERGERAHITFESIAPDDSLHHFHSIIVPEYGPGGDVVSALCMAHDVTEQIEAGQRLRRSEQRLMVALEAGGFGMFAYESASGLVHLDKRSREMMGLGDDCASATAAMLLGCVHPDDLPGVKLSLLRHRRSPTAVRSTVEFRLRASGVPRSQWLCATCMSVHDSAGGLVHVIGVLSDITEHHNREESLRLSEARYRLLFHANPIGVVEGRLDDGRILEANDAYLRIVRRTRSDLDAGHVSWSNITPPEWLAVDEEHIRRSIETGSSVPYEKEYLRPDGTRVPVLVGFTRVDEQRAVAFVIDITERKQAEAKLDELNKRLHRAVYESSHRIKNHLQMLAATADLAVDEGNETVPADEVRRLGAQARMLAGIHDLLTLEAKVDAENQAVPVRPLLERVLVGAPHTRGRRGHELDVADVALPVRSATALALLANELVTNSAKHGQGTIRIHYRHEGPQALLTVTDQGAGFPPGFDAATAANTGLELIAMLARTDLAGEVQYGNAATGGARVVVRFPLRASARA